LEDDKWRECAAEGLMEMLVSTEFIFVAAFDAVKDLKIPYNGETLQVTISVGVSVLHEGDHNPLDFYKRVDANLYHSKKNGRQQITIG